MSHLWAVLWPILLGVAAGFVLIWTVLLILLWRSKLDQGQIREALRLLPDVVRLLRRLGADPERARGVRLRLTLLLVYLAIPIDIVPDFIPVLGYADDAIVVALVLRSVVRRSGAQVIDKHWPGTADGLEAVRRFAGV